MSKRSLSKKRAKAAEERNEAAMGAQSKRFRAARGKFANAKPSASSKKRKGLPKPAVAVSDAAKAALHAAPGVVAKGAKAAGGAAAGAASAAVGKVKATRSGGAAAAGAVGAAGAVDAKAAKASKHEKAAKAPKPAKAPKGAGANATEVMTARLFFTAAFPTIQVLLDDDPKLARKFAHMNKTIQFGAHNGKEGLLCCTMRLQNGRITSEEGPAAKPDLTLTFASVEQMNALLKGGLAVPAIHGSKRLLADFLPLLLGLKVMAKPNAELKDEAEGRLKVKMSLYMITRALSKYNKLGDPDMVEFCLRQPERIYQFAVDDGAQKNAIACYLRIAEGKSKSGHGIYERRTPFVLFHFFSIDGALKVLGGECEFVEGVENGYVETIGSPEYACYLNDYMAIIQGMMM